MITTRLTLPQVGMIAATRGALGAGIGLLVGSRIEESSRKRIGWALLLAGALTTAPLLMMAWKGASQDTRSDDSRAPSDGTSNSQYREKQNHMSRKDAADAASIHRKRERAR